MEQNIDQKLNRLSHLAETAENPKILLEEIRLVSAEAFQLQDDLMALLDEAEKVETDIETVQTLFETRESVWDVINKIALREKEIKESHASREAFKKHQAQEKGKKQASDCHCEHHDDTEVHANGCHCGHHGEHEEHTHECCCRHHGEHEEQAHECCCGHHKKEHKKCSHQEQHAPSTDKD